MKPDKPITADADSDRIRPIITEKAVDQRLGCADAFEIAARLGVPPLAVGRTMDQMNFRIIHCQLGLFGYSPEKKIVVSETGAAPELRESIEKAATNGRISCRRIWQIAETHRVSKLSVSNACEGMGLKIKPCQLGAF